MHSSPWCTFFLSAMSNKPIFLVQPQVCSWWSLAGGHWQYFVLYLSKIVNVFILLLMCLCDSKNDKKLRTPDVWPVHWYRYSIYQLIKHCFMLSIIMSYHFTVFFILTAYLGDIVSSVPDHHNKINIAVKQVTQFFFISQCV